MGGNCPTQVLTLQGISTDAISNIQMQKPREGTTFGTQESFPLEVRSGGSPTAALLIVNCSHLKLQSAFVLYVFAISV